MYIVISYANLPPQNHKATKNKNAIRLLLYLFEQLWLAQQNIGNIHRADSSVVLGSSTIRYRRIESESLFR